MPASTSDLFTKVGNPGTATTLSAPGYTTGSSTSVNVGATTNFPTDTAVVFSIDTVTIVNGVEVRNANSYGVFLGIVTNGTTIGSVSLLYGTPQNYAAGATTRVYITDSAVYTNRLITGLLAEHKTTGAHAAITATSVTSTGAITAPSFVLSGGSGADGYNIGLPAPNTVTYNGNRSYDLVFNGSDQTSILSSGMKLRTARTVAAPTQCTNLNGTSQYYSRTSTINGMTFTDDFVAGAWVKLSSYTNTDMVVIGRHNSNTGGWFFGINATGQVYLNGSNGASSNFNRVLSVQSVPLNRWVHITAQLDMSSSTLSGTTNYVMFDGVDVACQKLTNGTAPTALVQAGNLDVGVFNTAVSISGYFPGKIAQAFVFSAKVTQATMRGYISQGLAGTESNLATAYSFNNSINDLNTTNANNLTSGGSAVATTVDSPFSQNDTNVPGGTNDYAIVTKKVFSTNTTVTVQVPEGCTIPTTGGVSAVVYSSSGVPFGFPKQCGRWIIKTLSLLSQDSTSNPTAGVWVNATSLNVIAPVGEWRAVAATTLIGQRSTTGPVGTVGTLSTANNTESNPEHSAIAEISAPATGNNPTVIQTTTKQFELSVSAATLYYYNYKASIGSSGLAGLYHGDGGSSKIELEPAYL